MSESYETFLREQGGEDACYDFFLRCRWPDGYRCPACDHRAAYTISTRRMPLFECTRCHYQASVTSGTILEGTRTPLSKWLFAMQRIIDPSAGINAVQLAELVHVTYKTAYAMLDKIRQCLSSTESDKLAGRIEAGLAIYGRDNLSSFELTDTQQPLAVGMSYDESDRPARFALMEIPREYMLSGTITPLGCDLFKDRHFASDPYSQENIIYRSRYLTKRHCKNLATIFKAGFKRLNDTYHGVHPRHLFKYLAEFTFRWNTLQQGSNKLLRIAQACACLSPSHAS
ncbi:transposase [Cohnella thailandensis]|uniref:IS1595 family transposase n=1 Tax=Cohnella thailandensis TaxID=557557 RepID=A0A841T7E2_9BACL|nr:transposase [Cohnella thailandensis]MBB6638188.1 IS1595 family transposase [Cohnella thailandensis]MBP1977822.1 transposase-like protein [Cohnella thailandensis]